jgi:hypothetical protein
LENENVGNVENIDNIESQQLDEIMNDIVADFVDIPHRLGSGGYNTAEKKWKKSDVISSSSSSLGITSKAKIRSFRWCMARAKPTAEGPYEILNPATEEVLQ